MAADDQGINNHDIDLNKPGWPVHVKGSHTVPLEMWLWFQMCSIQTFIVGKTGHYISQNNVVYNK